MGVSVILGAGVSVGICVATEVDTAGDAAVCEAQLESKHVITTANTNSLLIILISFAFRSNAIPSVDQFNDFVVKT
jgi:hypothetical protein